MSTARRVLLVSMTIPALLTVLASPAWAHGGGAPDASNFSSQVDAVVAAGPDGEPLDDAARADGVTWRVVANDALLEVRNRTDTELAVPGYDGEPYLRITPEGVWENRNSPSVYLNTDRYARVELPASASAEAEPEWVQVGEEPVHRWHDHRVHWMAQTLPPRVKADPDRTTVVQEWSVPFTLDGSTRAVQGRLRWVPSVARWPWLTAALVVTTLPVVVAAATSHPRDRRRRVIRAAAAVLALVTVANLLHTVDDVLAMPATWWEHLTELVRSAPFVAISGFAAWRSRHDGDGAIALLALGATAAVGGIGLTHLASLTSSQVVTVLPVGFTRMVVAANLAVLLPATLTVLWARRHHPSEPSEDASQPAAVSHG